MKLVAAAVCSLLMCVADAQASMVYATSVHSFSGSSTGENPLFALGAPDLSIIQLVDAGGQLILDFGAVQTAPGTLSVYTYDELFPSAATVEVSYDLSSFSVVAPVLFDTIGPAGTFPHADLPVASPFRYVRFTSIIGPDGEPAGFDLDAVGYMASDVVATPEPTSMALLGLASLGGIGLRLRQRRRTTNSALAAKLNGCP